MGRVQGLLSDSTISDVGALMSSMRELMADLAAVADGQEAEFRTLMESLQRSAANMEGITGSEEWNATLVSAENTMASLQRTSATVNESVGSLNTVLGRLERGEGTLGKLLTTDELHTSVNSTLQSLEELLDDIRGEPRPLRDDRDLLTAGPGCAGPHCRSPRTRYRREGATTPAPRGSPSATPSADAATGTRSRLPGSGSPTGSSVPRSRCSQ